MESPDPATVSVKFAVLVGWEVRRVDLVPQSLRRAGVSLGGAEGSAEPPSKELIHLTVLGVVLHHSRVLVLCARPYWN